MKIKIMKSLLSVSILAAMTNGAFAAGTAAGTPVNNTATINYKVGTVTQTPILSSPDGLTPTGEATSFVVDKKIDLTVTEGSDASVTPGQSGASLTYTLQNTGNSTEYFKLSDSQVGSDQFNAASCVITAAAPAVAGTGADTYQLAADETTTVTVSCDIPLTPSNADKSNIDLSATAVTTTAGTTAHTESTTDTAAGTEVVLADANATTTDSDTLDGAARNATHSAVNSYVINTADLVVTKTQAVTAMPINGADDLTDTNFHIPGSTIEYTITVVNSATAATATDIVLTDTVPGSLTVVGIPTIVITGGNGGTATMASGSGVSAVATNGFSLDPAETATLTITATVN